MPITREQAIELADKYFLQMGSYVLKDNISVSKSDRGWEIVGISTPAILGMQTEVSKFDINMETGEIGAVITTTITITDALRQIKERNDLSIAERDELKTKIEEFEKESKKPIDKNKMTDLKKWFETNAPYLKSVIDMISSILKLISG